MTAPPQTTTRFAPPGQNEVDSFIERAQDLEAAVGTVVIGQKEVVRETLIALFANGHVLLEGVPGLGKTLLVRTLGAALGLSFSRVQFTPDLMPADITGTTILREDESGRRMFSFQAGPIFAHILLADEINRATPKTQSALLEAMQERTVTVGRDTHPLPDPFFVLATQNPLEQEGTYPLPEAQLDRFLFKVLVPIPPPAVLRAIAEQTISEPVSIDRVLDGETLSDMIRIARAVPIAGPIMDYAVDVVVATQPETTPVKSVQQFVRAGASTRALQALVTCGQVRALLDGRFNVAVEDIQALAPAALRHRILVNFEGYAQGITTDTLVTRILDELPIP